MGSGSFGKFGAFIDLPYLIILLVGYVFEAIDPHTGESVAIKRTSKSGEYVSREFEVLDRLRGC